MHSDLHPFQISILKELLFRPQARFRDLKRVDIPNDHFSFHLRSLISQGFIEKTLSGYSLTISGKQAASLIDTETNNFEKQAKISVALHAIRYVNNEIETLVHQRLKQPYYGWYGFHSGKIRFGESPLDCAQREFLEETGLQGKFELKAILHWVDSNPAGKILEDKYFFLFFVTQTSGDLKVDLPEGRNEWMGETQYRALPHTFGSWDSIIEEFNSPSVYFKEVRKTRDEF